MIHTLQCGCIGRHLAYRNETRFRVRQLSVAILVFGSQNNTADETNGVNNAVSCYKETVVFWASFVMLLLCLPVFDEIC